jgi:hypothetical protein
MAIDMRKAVLAVAEAALADNRPSAPEKPKPHLSTGHAVLLGAGLMTAGRFIASSRGRQVLASIQEFVAEERLKLQADDQDDYEDEEPEAETDEDFDDEDDYEDEEPEAETDEDFDDEDDYEDEEPEAETDEDFDDEDDYEDEEPEAEDDEQSQRKPRRKAANRGRS